MYNVQCTVYISDCTDRKPKSGRKTCLLAYSLCGLLVCLHLKCVVLREKGVHFQSAHESISCLIQHSGLFLHRLSKAYGERVRVWKARTAVLTNTFLGKLPWTTIGGYSDERNGDLGYDEDDQHDASDGDDSQWLQPPEGPVQPGSEAGGALAATHSPPGLVYHIQLTRNLK